MKRNGFTLIETVIAMVILSGAILVLTNSWSGSMLAVRKSRSLNKAALLLQRKLTEYELKYEGKPLTEVKEEEEGTFEDLGDEYKDFKWSMKSKKLEVPDLSAGMTAKEGGANEMELMVVKKLTEVIEKSVVELKVTVTQTIHAKTYDFSATTYVVDYTTNLGAAGVGP